MDHLLAALIARYGEERGHAVYAAMRAEGRGPFGPRGKLNGEHLRFADSMGVDPLAVNPERDPAQPSGGVPAQPGEH